MRDPPTCAALKERIPPPFPPPPCPPPPWPPPCPPPPRASASGVRRGTTRSSTTAMQAPVGNTGLTTLQHRARRPAASDRAAAYLHERRASTAPRASISSSRRRRP